MKTRYSTKYFPFSPGIPWKIKNSKYIVPELDADIWDLVLGDKEIIVTCFGGAFESFFSLSYLEALSAIDSSRKLSWLGFEIFEPMLTAQRLASPSLVRFEPVTLEKYPAPLFLDAENNAYINVLNNYIETRSYWDSHPIVNKDPLAKQLFSNAMIAWDNSVPQLRRLEDISGEFIKRSKSSKLRLDRKFVLVIPDRCFGQLPYRCLDWGHQNVRELAAILRNFGLQVVVVSDSPHLYHGSRVHVVEPSILFLLNLVEKAFVILSHDIDWHLIAMMIGKGHIIAQDVSGPGDLYQNADFLGASNVISTEGQWISPMNVYELCKGFLT